MAIKWQYKIEPLEDDLIKLERQLVTLGEVGWELISTFNRNSLTLYHDQKIHMFAILKKQA